MNIFHNINTKTRTPEEISKLRDSELTRLYDWLMDEDREPANIKFTSGMLRNVASEIEFRFSKYYKIGNNDAKKYFDFKSRKK